jgi:hypothetical protein
MANQDVTLSSSELRRLSDAGGAIAAAAGVVGVGGMAAGVILGACLDGWPQFFRSYLTSFAFLMSLTLGALFFVMLQHLTRAGWSVVLRRLAELIAANVSLMAVLFLPILASVLYGIGDLYHWVHADPHDALLAHKKAWLNPTFFTIRAVIDFAVWMFLARYMLRRSLAQDADGDVAHTLAMQRVSAPGMLLYAVTLTTASFDWLMSLDPHWYSTIFGVYFFSGGVVGFFSLLALATYVTQRLGRLTHSISVDHFHDTGKLVFAFVVFWSYIAFSQYMLQWYANMPEGTRWQLVRQQPPWLVLSLVLLFGHFLLPFVALISRIPKRRVHLLIIGAAWVLIMHWFDTLYVVGPDSYGFIEALESGRTPVLPGSPLHLTDLALLGGMGGIYVWATLRRAARVALLPERDPRLAESLAFENI